jgi:FkbM family methyltransferase
VQVTEHLKAFPSFRPRVIAHVGAHLAEELADYEAAAPETIVWVEADPEIYDRLLAIVEAGKSPTIRHICINALITDAAGEEVGFHRFSNDGHSSSIVRAAENLHLNWPDVHEVGQELLLRSDTLANVLAGSGIAPERLDVLVLDVQGAELLALKGSGAYLDHVKFLEVEASTIPIYQGAPLLRELDPWIAARGFRRLSLVSFHGDAVYTRL